MPDMCYKIAREVKGHKKPRKELITDRRIDTISLMCIFRVNSEIISVSVSENKCQFQHKDRNTGINTPTNQHQSTGTSKYRESPISNLTKISNSKILLPRCETRLITYKRSSHHHPRNRPCKPPRLRSCNKIPKHFQNLEQPNLCIFGQKQ